MHACQWASRNPLFTSFCSLFLSGWLPGAHQRCQRTAEAVPLRAVDRRQLGHRGGGVPCEEIRIRRPGKIRRHPAGQAQGVYLVFFYTSTFSLYIAWRGSGVAQVRMSMLLCVGYTTDSRLFLLMRDSFQAPAVVFFLPLYALDPFCGAL